MAATTRGPMAVKRRRSRREGWRRRCPVLPPPPPPSLPHSLSFLLLFLFPSGPQRPRRSASYFFRPRVRLQRCHQTRLVNEAVCQTFILITTVKREQRVM